MVDRVQTQRAYWNNIADHYEMKYGYNTERGYNKLQRKADMMVEVLGLQRKDYVLELGCGTGAYTELLALKGINIVGLDISDKMLGIAYEKCGVYRRGDMHNLPFKDNSFDAIIGFYILHYADVPKVINECCRVLRTNGKLGFIEPNIVNPIVFGKTKISFIKKWLSISNEATSFSSKGLRKVFQGKVKDVATYHLEYGLLGCFAHMPLLNQLSGSIMIKGIK